MPKPSNLTLFCFPCAGASASVYFSWRRNAPQWLRIVPVELPGRGARLAQPLLRDFEQVVLQLTDQLLPDFSQPFAFFGHSFGALIAYGVALELRKRGRIAPSALIVACCSAPSRRDDERLTKLDTDDAIVEELRNLKGTPPELFEHSEMLRITVDVASADFAACRSFKRGDAPPLDTDIFVYGGADDDVTEESLDAWRLESSRRTTVEIFAGGHFFLREHESLFLANLFEKMRKI